MNNSNRRITIVTVLYKRINELPHQLDLLTQQVFPSDWEIIYWNNNYDKAGKIDDIITAYRSRMNISVIHSTYNYHCIVRQGIAAIAQGDLLFMMDDDIRPKENYLQHFVSAHERIQKSFGNSCFAIAACGHRFGFSAFGKTAKQVWEERMGLEFYDQGAPEIELDFAHANNLLINRELFLKAAAVSMPRTEFGLVDDYWFSYVLSHHLGARLVKIHANKAFSFSNSAFDPNVAMFYRKDVHKARLRFFEHHVRQGWPTSLDKRGG